MSLEPVTAPAEEPITLAEAKLHLRVDHADDDALITSLIAAARGLAETELNASLIEQTWDLWLDAFPAAEIRIPPPAAPLRSVVSIVYLDSAGTQQTLAANTYTADTKQSVGWVIPVPTAVWPATYDGVNAVRVRVTVGLSASAAAIDDRIKAWIKLQVGALYDQRSAAGERQTHPLVFVDRLLDAYRIYAV